MPVRKLTNEILRRIFEINANMDRDPNVGYLKNRFRAHNYVRWISQVSQQWRRVALYGSPLIWAKVIDFELFGPDNKWMNIVLKRASVKPLFVRVRITEVTLPSFNAFFEKYLGRIQTLELCVAMSQDQVTQDTLLFLTRPAESLVKFECQLPGLDGSLPFPPRLLFGDHAHLLRTFHSRNLAPNFRAPWIGQLRSLHLFDPSFRTLNIDQLYDALTHMPLLESLDISYTISPLESVDATPFADQCLSTDHNQKTVSLPRLKELALVGHPMNLCFSVMKMIIPRTGCKVNIAESKTLPSQVDLDASDCLARYVAGYFSRGYTSSALLRVTPREFTIIDSSSHLKSTENHVSFDLQFVFDDQFYAGRNFITTLLLREILSCPFPSITHLELELSPGAVQPSDDAFFGFIQSFSFVEVLTTTPETLRILSMIPGNADRIFPRLKTLKILELRLQDHRSLPVKLLKGSRMLGADVDFLLFFLVQRKEVGTPLEIFEFTLSYQSDLKDLSFLDEVANLKVKWTFGFNEGEYICGSGTPEQLNLEPELVKWNMQM